MTEKTFTIKDMVGFAAAGSAADFQAAFNHVASDRVADAIEAAREVVAQSFVQQAAQEEPQPDNGEVTDDEQEDPAE